MLPKHLLFSILFIFPLFVFSNTTTEENIHIKTAIKYLSINLDSAEHFAQLAILDVKKNDNLHTKASAYLVLARAASHAGDYLKSLEYFNLISVLIHELDNPQFEAHLNKHYALLNIRIKKFDKAVEYGLKAQSYFKQEKDSLELASIYNFFSGLYLFSNDLEKTIEYSQKSLEINKELQLTDQLASNYSNLGICYKLKAEYDTAIHLINKAIKINQHNNNKMWLAHNYHGIADIYLEQEKLEEAENYYLKSIRVYNELGNFADELSVNNVLAKINAMQGDTLKAIEKLQFTLDQATEKKVNAVRQSSLYALYTISESQKKHELALSYLKEYNKVKEKREQNNSSSVISIIELQKNFEDKREQLKHENELIRINAEKKNWYILLLSLLIILIAFAAFLIIKWVRVRNKSIRLENEQLNHELLLKNKELAVSIINAAKQHEERAHMVKQLQEVQQNVSMKQRPQIGNIIKELKSKKDAAIWEEFEMRFQNVHQGFYTRLHEIAPDLTPAEIKICAFLKLNMSTKEMASILYKSTTTIEVDRARIRKKLGLTNKKTNLVNFIMDI